MRECCPSGWKLLCSHLHEFLFRAGAGSRGDVEHGAEERAAGTDHGPEATNLRAKKGLTGKPLDPGTDTVPLQQKIRVLPVLQTPLLDPKVLPQCLLLSGAEPSTGDDDFCLRYDCRQRADKLETSYWLPRSQSLSVSKSEHNLFRSGEP